MVAIPILLPLVKPFRASWSGKPFFRASLHCGHQGNKASVRTEDFTEYPIWHKLWKAAGKYSARKRQRHLTFLPSAVPLHVQNELDQEAPMVFNTFLTMTSREKISSNRSSQIYSSESPRNPASRPSWRCASPKTVAAVRTYKVKRSLVGSHNGNGLESSACCKSLSAELCLVLQTRSKTDGTSFPKGRHFRHRIKYDKSEVVTNIRELTSKTIRWLYFRKRQPAFGRTIEQIIVWRPATWPHWQCEKQLSGV